MSLPIAWVDRIFEKLALVYGREFLSRWDGLSLDDVKGDWARELDGFRNWPEAIKYGIQNLPSDRPPTVLQFRDICRKAPSKEVGALPEPVANPDRVKTEIAKLRAMSNVEIDPITYEVKNDGRDWARKILAGVEVGDKRTPTVIRFAKEALGLLPAHR